MRQFAFSILICVNDSSQHKAEAHWQKTPVANLMRHVQSENYYARIRVRGKLIWKSLKTGLVSAAARPVSNPPWTLKLISTKTMSHALRSSPQIRDKAGISVTG